MGKRMHGLEMGLMALSLCLLAVVVGQHLLKGKGEKVPFLITVTVREKETLWGLARRWTPPEESLLKKVALIEEVNGLKHRTVRPGRKIRIPVSGEMARKSGRPEVARKPDPELSSVAEAPFAGEFSPQAPGG